jgi:nucleoid-associated protein YgaU
MLNKDEYNQDEYNDYYAQETRGAEISSGKNSGSGKKIIFILLLLLLIIALAYFGWKSMNSSDSPPTKIEKTDIVSKDVSREDNKTLVAKEPIIESVKKEPIVQKEPATTTQTEDIAKEVQKNVASTNSNAKMNPEDIANIVQMVMKKMNKDKIEESTKSNSSTKPVENSTNQIQDDKQLMESLSGSEVDSLSTVSDNVDAITEKDSSKKASSNEKPNTYNKVVLDDKTEKSSDELSKLSDEISSAIDTEESASKDNTDYTQAITKEVKTRTKEMRYVTVKRGDTLGKIAKKVYGNVMYYKKIYEANPDILRRPDRIYIGQRLRVPE